MLYGMMADMGSIIQDFTTDAAITYISANGTYRFSPACNVLKMSFKPILDAAKRTVTHSIVTIILEDIIQATDQLDGTKVDTTSVRRILNTPAGGLTVQGVGIGDFAVNIAPFSVLFNPASTVYDCMWGPIPVELSWENYGNGKAGKIVWQVTCATAEQCANAASRGQVMAYCYDAVFKNDKAGYGSRTITGYVEIPMTRSAPDGRVPPDNVDRLRESCYPSIAVGWARKDASWKVSMDRRRADFSYTDEEQPPNAPAAGVVNCDENQSVESGDYLLGRQTTTLTGTYEMAKARARSESWVHFTKFCKSRITAITNACLQQNLALGNNVTLANCWPIPIKLHLYDTVHSRTSGKFSLVLQYTLAAADFGTAIANAVIAAGLWTPPLEGGHNYAPWNQSMIANGVFTPRGIANTSFPNNAGTDTIIDLCLNSSPATLTGNNIIVGMPALNTATIVLPAPPARSSFLDYRVGLHVSDFDSVVELKPLPTKPILYTGGDSTLSTISNSTLSTFASVDGFKPAYPNSPVSVFQDRSGTHTAVTVYGAALRAGYLITPPKLQLIGGVTPRRQNREGNFFKQWLYANYGIPIFAAVWSQRYLLPSQPNGYPVLPNPLYSAPATQIKTLHPGPLN
jgi:hypothetical protein